MVAQIRSSSAASTSDGGSLAVPAPAGVPNGDLLVAVQHTNNASQLANLAAPDTSWATVATSTSPGSMKVYTKTATGSEPTSYPFTGGASDWSCSILAVQAGTYDPADPFATDPVFSTATGSATAHVAPSVTGVTGGQLVTVFGACGSANAVRTYTPPSGMTERTDTNSGGWTAQAVTTQELTADGASGTRTATLSASTPYKAAAFVIAPAPAAAPTVDAGPDDTITLGQTFTRTATATNEAAITSRSWDLRTGNSPTVIGGGPTVEWTPTAVGTYVIRHSAIHSGGTAYDEVTVTVVSAPVGNPKLATLTEDGSGFLTATWPNRTPDRVVVNNGAAEVTTAGTTGEYNAISTDQVWDATESSLSAKIATAEPNTSHGTYLSIELDSGNLARIYRDAGGLRFGVMSAGTEVTTTVGAYSPADHAWWRIREAAGRFHFAFSADGSTWTEHATSHAHAWNATDVYVLFMVGRWQASDPAATGSIARVNLGPAVTEPPAVITWREEFTGPLSLTQPDGTPGRWRNRGADDTGPVDQGYVEYVARNWNVSPFQHPDHNPFTVADSVLSISAKRNPGIPGVPVSTAAWLGGYLSTEPATSGFGYGYYEIRARVPVAGRGMFPAIWMYNNRIGDAAEDPSKAAAEIDLMEVFGDTTGQPWVSTAHLKPTPGTQVTIATQATDTAGWHRYGLNWTADVVDLYRDGVLVAALTSTQAQWFRDVELSIRLNFAVDPAFAGTPQSTTTDPPAGTVFRLDVDYVRAYDKKPPALATGTHDPTPPVRVVDRWTGTQLVPQRTDRWTGSALTQQTTGS